MNQCPEMAIGEGFWNVPKDSPWTVKYTLKGKLGFEGEMLCQNGLQQSRHSLFLFLEFQIQGRIRAPRASILTL